VRKYFCAGKALQQPTLQPLQPLQQPLQQPSAVLVKQTL
jgi:hypothetical protein